MNTCKTCCHWGDKTVGENDGVTFDSYGVRHYCWLLSHDESKGYKTLENNDAESVAHGIGGACIATGPDFGCIHWSERIEPSKQPENAP